MDPARGPKKNLRDRVANLSDQLCVLHDGLDTDKSGRYNTLSVQVTHLDRALAESQDHTDKRFNALTKSLGTCQNDLDKERQAREELFADKVGELQHIDTLLTAALESEMEARRTAKVRILQAFDARTNELKGEIETAGRNRMETNLGFRTHLEQDIPRLYEVLLAEVKDREAMEQRMLRRAMEEVTQLQAAILEEKRAREDTEEAMLRMMEDIVTKAQEEIEEERTERAAMEAHLLVVLNETCSRLQLR